MKSSGFLNWLPDFMEKERGWSEARTYSFVPIPSVGCYIPGGQARYPSSAIMSVVPARIAGVKRIVVVSPHLVVMEKLIH